MQEGGLLAERCWPTGPCTLDILAQYGCDSAQGHLFSRALTAEELTPWLTESPYEADTGPHN